MAKLLVANWAERQTYRKDRGTPPWIKVHRDVMTSTKWAALGDHEKGALVSIWIVAADNNGEIPADPKVLKKICQLDTEPDILKLIDLGLLIPTGCQLDVNLTPQRRQPDANLASTGCQLDAPETETETETETDITTRKRSITHTQTPRAYTRESEAAPNSLIIINNTTEEERPVEEAVVPPVFQPPPSPSSVPVTRDRSAEIDAMVKGVAATKNASTTPQAIDIVKEYDNIILEIYGEQSQRIAPSQMDCYFAQQFLNAGASLAMLSEMFRERLLQKKITGHPPPGTLKYFVKIVEEAIKNGAAQRSMTDEEWLERFEREKREKEEEERKNGKK